ncbi:hypothetical protein [Alistipes sp. ZOR0009]|uniref:hypothetical protein n=1 Tax=Alistipes sp. ZOR0009 TaxID=1339253 RepID=UPI000645BC83|nr:hypothetical protein [Alistipes sp. ZOR0009]
MPEIKKTPNTPPAQLVNAVTSLSKSDNWKEAKEEWDMDKYFYNTSGYKACPCSPREVRNITVLRNRYNFNELEICNSCAERYFGIGESSRIEAVVRRIKKDPTSAMGFLSQCYLFINKVIDRNEFNNYSTLSGKRKYDQLQSIIEETNKKLLRFTDYRHQSVLKKFDAIWVGAAKDSRIVIDCVLHRWKQLIVRGQSDEPFLDSFIENYRIRATNPNLNELRAARMRLDNCFQTCKLSENLLLAAETKKLDYKESCPNVESGFLYHDFMLIGLEDANGKVTTMESLGIDYDSGWMRSELNAMAKVYLEASRSNAPVFANRMEYSSYREDLYEEDYEDYEEYEDEDEEYEDDEMEACRPDVLELLFKCGWPEWINQLSTLLLTDALDYDLSLCKSHDYMKFGSYGHHKKRVIDRLNTLDNIEDFRTLKNFHGFDDFTDYDEDDRTDYYLDFLNLKNVCIE